MAGDFEPIVLDMPGRTIRVWAVSDVHLGSKECDVDGFRKFVRKVAEDADSYVILAGDLIDNSIAAPASVWGCDPTAQIEQAVEILRPLADAGKILGGVGGNHEARTIKLAGINPTALIFTRLGIGERFRDNLAFIRVNMRKGGIHNTYNILVSHGASRGKLDKLWLSNIDVHFHGHTHDPDVRRLSYIHMSEKGNVTVRHTLSITCPSWLHYENSYGSAKGYSPKPVGNPQHVILEFTNTNSRRGEPKAVW